MLTGLARRLFVFQGLTFVVKEKENNSLKNLTFDTQVPACPSLSMAQLFCLAWYNKSLHVLVLAIIHFRQPTEHHSSTPHRIYALSARKPSHINLKLNVWSVRFLSGKHTSHLLFSSQMIFYLHMSGDGIGTLRVYRVSGSQHRLLLNLTGDQGNYWQRREVNLTAPEDFQVMFEGKIGRGTRGDICLDDITFSPGCLLSSSPLPVEPTLPPSGDLPHLSITF